MCKRLFEQRMTYYNGQWYCYLCKIALRSSTEANRHSKIAHSSAQTFNLPSDSGKLRTKAYKTFVKHGIVIRDVQRDYFCMNCRCSVPSSNDIYRHVNEKSHQKRVGAKLKRSASEQRDSSGNASSRRSKVSVKASRRTNESSLSSQTQAISKSKGASNGSTRTVNGTGVPLPQEAKTYKPFLMEHTIHGQWYCHPCESMFRSLADVKRHAQEAHPDVGTRTPDSPDAIREESPNRRKTKDPPQEYLCASCQCLVPCLGNFHEHSTGKKHKRMVRSNENTNIAPENGQPTVSDDINDREVSVNAVDGNDVVEDLPSNFRVEAKSASFYKYFCDQCNKTIEEDDVISHEITAHGSDMKPAMRYVKDWSKTWYKDFNIACNYPLFRCSSCNEVIHGMLSLAIHLSKREHEKSIELFSDTEERGGGNRRIHFAPRESSVFLISFEKNGGTVRIKEQRMMRVQSSTEKFIYVCLACPRFNQMIYHDIIKHLCKTEHLKHFKNIFLTYNYVHDILTSKERGKNRTREMSLVSEEDASSNTGSLNNHEINEAEVKQRDHGLTAVPNENDGLRQDEENNTGLFISLDIFMDINAAIGQPVDSARSRTIKPNEKSALERYNNVYSGEFLDFEEIMFTCSERKLNEMKSNLPFFVSHCSNMLCLVCSDPQSCDAQAVYEHINCGGHATRFAQLHQNADDLELLKELIQPVRFQKAKCFACDKTFDGIGRNNSVDFIYHARFPAHKANRKQSCSLVESILGEFQNLCYNIQYFACVQCNVRVKQKIKFLEHLKAKHKAVLNNKDNSMFDFCLTCATLWYDKHCTEETYINYRKHCQRAMHQYLRKSNDFAVTSLPQSLQKLLKNVSGTANDLFDLSNDVLHDRRVVQVTDALRHIFETRRLPVEVHTFGSRVTGLALPNSDIDMFLNFGNECTEPELIKNRSKQIQNCLRTDQENWNIELTLDKSRTPIIKVKHRLTGLQCDISFTNGLSVENSKLIRSFNTAYPLCQKLTLFLKKWLSLGSLVGSDGITNYALVWLVIFYLQVKFEVPSIAALIKSHNQSKIVSGWETGVGDTILINAPQLPIHELLLGFFEYYKSFDYMHFVICPLLGETFQKRAFTEISTLPDSMALYVAQLQNKNPEYFRIDSSMCVQDPFDLSHNLTKAVSILMLKRFKYYCNESSRILLQLYQTKKS